MMKAQAALYANNLYVKMHPTKLKCFVFVCAGLQYTVTRRVSRKAQAHMGIYIQYKS